MLSSAPRSPRSLLGAAPRTRPKGMTLNGFDAFVRSHGGPSAFAGLSTSDVVPWAREDTRASQLSYVALHDNKPWVAEATVFISHSYGYSFLGVLQAIERWEMRLGRAAAGPLPAYYFDLFCNNQHAQQGIVPFTTLQQEYGESVRAIAHTLVVLEWHELQGALPPRPQTALSRAWCVYEMFSTLQQKGALEVVMSPEGAAAFSAALVDDFPAVMRILSTVDVESASAREPRDRRNIFKAIREVPGGGFLSTNQLVIGGLREWMIEVGQGALEEEGGERAAVLRVNLASLLHMHGRFGEARRLLEQALEAQGIMPPAFKVAALRGLTELLRGMGELPQAVERSEELCACLEGPEALEARHAIASMQYSMGLPAALNTFRELLVEARGCPDVVPWGGAFHLKVLRDYALALEDSQDTASAQRVRGAIVECLELALPKAHPEVLRMQSLVATEWQALEKILVAQQAALGRSSPLTLATAEKLATAYLKMGRVLSAEPLLMEVWYHEVGQSSSAFESLLGVWFPLLGIIILVSVFGMLFVDLSLEDCPAPPSLTILFFFFSGLLVMVIFLLVFLRLYLATKPLCCIRRYQRHHRGAVHSGRRDIKPVELSAEEGPIKEAWEEAKESHGETDLRTLRALHEYALFKLDQGELAVAVELCTDALEFRQKVLCVDHPDTLQSYSLLGNLHFKLCDYAAAEVHLRRAFEGREKLHDEWDDKCIEYARQLAECLLSQHKLDAAEGLFEKALSLLRARAEQGASSLRIASITQSLASLCVRQSKLVRAFFLQWEIFVKIAYYPCPLAQHDTKQLYAAAGGCASLVSALILGLGLHAVLPSPFLPAFSKLLNIVYFHGPLGAVFFLCLQGVLFRRLLGLLALLFGVNYVSHFCFAVWAWATLHCSRARQAHGDKPGLDWSLLRPLRKPPRLNDNKKEVVDGDKVDDSDDDEGGVDDNAAVQIDSEGARVSSPAPAS